MGEIPEDKGVCLWEAFPRHLRYFQESSQPQKRCLVAWHGAETVLHCAVVTHAQPILLVQRASYRGAVETKVSFDKVHKQYSHHGFKYYLPRKMKMQAN